MRELFNTSRAKEYIAGLTLTGVLASGLGAAACSTETGGQTNGNSTTIIAPECSFLNDLNTYGPSKAGGENAKNTGPCVLMYDRETGQNTGTIARDAVFLIKCQDQNPFVFNVETREHATGYVTLDGPALRQALDAEFADIPQCNPL